MTDDYLNILNPIKYDTNIESLQYSEYSPESQSNLNNATEIKIVINASDSYLIPAKSFIHIKGQLVRSDNNIPFDANSEIALVNNAMMYLFNSMTLVEIIWKK